MFKESENCISIFYGCFFLKIYRKQQEAGTQGTKAPQHSKIANRQFTDDQLVVGQQKAMATDVNLPGKQLSVIAGLRTTEEANEVNSLAEITVKTIVSNFFKESSTKLIFRLGISSTGIIYTPDVDGVTRDENGNSAIPDPQSDKQRPSTIFKFNGKKEDLRRAATDPAKYISLVSSLKIR